MGSGASCEASPSAPNSERLRTMLILRAYNCRPRNWTMRDQFDSFAEDGILTKNHLREALRLSECPQIEATLDRFIRGHSAIGDKSCAAGSISVAALISFVEAGASNVRPLQGSLPTVDGHSSNQPALSQSAIPACTSSVEVHEAHPPATGSQPHFSAPPTNISDASVDGNGVETFPRVIPLTPKWKPVPPTVADRKTTGSASVTPSGREEHRGSGENPPSTLGEEGKDPMDALEVVNSSPQGATGDIGRQPCSKHAFGHCTTLVKRLGSVLRLRGKEAYRRAGPFQPVWRKRETLIQERIVQYTTVDEEGMIQELMESEKSQTEVLHMECKQTGEFAHRESTHYESGEAFNGEIVVEESGVEHYVHMRSVDDEYEHLESTLPPRARQGAATGTAPAGDEAPGAGEDGSSINAGGGVAGREAEVGGSSSGIPGAAERRHGEDEGATAGVRNNQPNTSTDQHEQRQEFPEAGEHKRSESSPAPQSSSPQPSRTRHGCEDDTGSRRNGNTPNVAGVGAGVRRHPSPSPPSPSYHYRSPSCSPRLSPRPARSPYRQEGVGGRESSGRGERRRWYAREEQHEEDEPSPGVKLSAATDTEEGRVHSVLGPDCSTGEENQKVSESGRFVEEQEDEGGGSRRWATGSSFVVVPPVSAPIPRSYLGETNGIDGAQNERYVNGGIGSALWCDTNKPANTKSDFRPPWDDTPPGIAMSGFGGSGGVSREGSVDSGESRCGSVMFFDNVSDKGGDVDGKGADDGDWGQAKQKCALEGVPISCGDDPATVFNSSGEKVDFPLSAAEHPTNETTVRSSTSRDVNPSTAGNSNNADEVSYLFEGSSSYRPRSNGVDSSAPLAASALGGDGSKERCLAGGSNISDVGAGNEGGREVMYDAEKAAASLSGHAPFHSYVWDRTASSPHGAVEETGGYGFVGGAGVDDSNQCPGHGVVV